MSALQSTSYAPSNMHSVASIPSHANRSSWAVGNAAYASKNGAEALEKASREERLKKLRENHGLNDREAEAAEAVCKILKERDGTRDVVLATERSDGLVVLEFPETKSIDLEIMKKIENVDLALHRDQRYDPVSGILRVELIDRDHDPSKTTSILDALDGERKKATPTKRTCSHVFEELSVGRASELSRCVCEKVLSRKAKIPANASVNTLDSEIAEGRVKWQLALCNVGRLRYSFLRMLEKDHENQLSGVDMFKDEDRHLVLRLCMDIDDKTHVADPEASNRRVGRKRKALDSNNNDDADAKGEKSGAKKRRPSSCLVS